MLEFSSRAGRWRRDDGNGLESSLVAAIRQRRPVKMRGDFRAATLLAYRRRLTKMAIDARRRLEDQQYAGKPISNAERASSWRDD